LPCDVTATVQIAKWVYQQTEKANGQVWVMEKVLRHLSAEWSQVLCGVESASLVGSEENSSMSASGLARSTDRPRPTEHLAGRVPSTATLPAQPPTTRIKKIALVAHDYNVPDCRGLYG